MAAIIFWYMSYETFSEFSPIKQFALCTQEYVQVVHNGEWIIIFAIVLGKMRCWFKYGKWFSDSWMISWKSNQLFGVELPLDISGIYIILIWEFFTSLTTLRNLTASNWKQYKIELSHLDCLAIYQVWNYCS